jgi:hypothetical protein
VSALLVVAVYILFKAVVEAIDPGHTIWSSTGEILQGVSRTALVVLGVTVAARLPRLTRNPWLRAAGIGIGLATCALYYVTAPPGNEAAATHRFLGLPPGMPTALLGVSIIGLAYLFGALLPSWGVVPLMLAGSIVVAGKIIWHVLQARQVSEVGPIWPVFLATGLFLYLWWLAVLIFDLVVIWHWYIRNAQLLERMDEIMGGKRGAARPREAGVEPASADYAPQVQQ